MQSRLLAGIAGVLVISLATLTPTLPVSYAQSNSATQADPQPSVVRANFYAHGPVALAPSTDDRPKVIDPKTYNKFTGPNLSKRVVPTFDDCPNSLAELNSVLTYVFTHNIGVVFAPTGECVEKYKRKYNVDIGELIRANGQYVINHSYSHPNLTKLKKNGKIDVRRVKAQLTTEVKTDYGRAPYGATNKGVDKVYASIGMRQWLWSKDTDDWKKGKTRAQVVNYVGTHAAAGDTVLMHMQHKGFDPVAIAQMSTMLEKRGLSLCRAFRGWANPAGGPVRTTPELLGDHAIPC